MTQIELILMGVGLVVFAASSAVFALKRRSFTRIARVADNPGLLPSERMRSLPDGVDGALADVIRSSSVSNRQVFVTLVELAVAGRIRLAPLVDGDDPQPYDWTLTLVDPSTDGLNAHQSALLDQMKSTSPGRTTTVSALISSTSEPLKAARRVLHEEAHGRGWVPVEGAAEFRNVWGLLGGALILLGLVSAVVIIVGNIVDISIQGLLGPLFIAVSGAMLTALAPMQAQHTPQATMIRDQVDAHRTFLTGLTAEDIDPTHAHDQFSEWTPAFLAFDAAEPVGAAFDVAAERAGRWGTQVDWAPTWLDLPANVSASRPSDVARLLGRLVTQGAARTSSTS